jgi:hypothetical protein
MNELFICIKFIYLAINNKDLIYLKSYYLKLIEESLADKKNVFLIDQPFFIEQVFKQDINLLKLNALVIVVRNPLAQLGDWINNGKFLAPETIKESFLLGSPYDVGNLSDLQAEIMMLVLLNRVKKIENLRIKFGSSLAIISFESLISGNIKVIDKLNEFFRLNGYHKDLLDGSSALDFLCKSRKNIMPIPDLLSKYPSLKLSVDKINNYYKEIDFLG